MLCDRMDIDIWEVIDAAATKPFGFMRFEPGPGMGGHCLPSTRSTSPSRRASTTSTPSSSSSPERSTSSSPTSASSKIDRALNDVGKPVKRLAHPAARRLLQGRGRRHARVAGAEDRPRCCASSAPRSPTTTRTCPRCRELGLASVDARRGARGARPRLRRHRPPGGRLRAGRRRGAARPRLPRRHARDRGGEPRPPLRPLAMRSARLASAQAARADRLTVGSAGRRGATAGTVMVGELRRAWHGGASAAESTRASRRRPAVLETAEQAIVVDGPGDPGHGHRRARGLRGDAAPRDRPVQHAHRVRRRASR